LPGRVIETQLDLFKLAAGCAAKLGASASEVMLAAGRRGHGGVYQQGRPCTSEHRAIEFEEKRVSYYRTDSKLA
jgi:hypothetical protein